MSDASTLPHWQLTSIYPGLDSEPYRRDRANLSEAIAAFEAALDAHGVRRGSAHDAAHEAADATLGHLSELAELVSTLGAYLSARVAVDADDEAAQAELSVLRTENSRLSTLEARWVAWLGDQDVDAVVAGSEKANELAFWVREAAERARHLLGDEAEALAAALDDSGGGAWGRLHGRLTATATTRDPIPGKPDEPRNLAALKALQHERDRATRKAAFEAELRLLDGHAQSFAAAMNGVKGQVRELTVRRGYDSVLDLALEEGRVDRPVLEAMQEAVRSAFELPRRYLRAKARAMGTERLAWFDLLAPMGEVQEVTWPDAVARVEREFAAFDPRLAGFARRAVDEGWIDVPPRPGKRSGAFCMPVLGRDESRVMVNFGGSLSDVFTLAHELGHGYHNACLFEAGRDPLLSDTPMTLAETASTFCESLLVDAALEGLDGDARLALLELDLQRATQLLVDIDSRFRFESRVFDERADRELSLAELDEAMLAAQDATYGDTLDPDARHPRMWAQKPHYYSSGRSFYNFPYTFGHLFGLGLLQTYREQPGGFPDRYRELLADTGRATPAQLAARFDVDLSDPAFWQGALHPLQARVRAFETLVEERT